MALTVWKHSDVQIYTADAFVQCANQIYFISLSYTTAGDWAVRWAVCLFRCHHVDVQYWGDLILTIFEDLGLKIWPQQICRMESCCIDFRSSFCSSVYVWANCEVVILVWFLRELLVFGFFLSYPFKQRSVQTAMCSKVILYCFGFHPILCFFFVSRTEWGQP